MQFGSESVANSMVRRRPRIVRVSRHIAALEQTVGHRDVAAVDDEVRWCIGGLPHRDSYLGRGVGSAHAILVVGRKCQRKARVRFIPSCACHPGKGVRFRNRMTGFTILSMLDRSVPDPLGYSKSQHDGAGTVCEEVSQDGDTASWTVCCR